STPFGAGDAMASGGSYAPGLSAGGATSGAANASSTSSAGTPVANAPGSAIGAPSLPTNILLAPTTPLTTNNGPSAVRGSPDPAPTSNPISPQGGPGGGGGGPFAVIVDEPQDFIPDINCG